MTISVRAFLLPLATLLLSGAAPASEDSDRLAPERIRAHVEFLASDLMEGRGIGTHGNQVAAAYVASEFRELGLAPAGTDGGWTIYVPLRRARHASPPTLTYSAAGRASALKSGVDFGMRPSLLQQSRSIDAPLVFVGHGLNAPLQGIDDYSGIDVRGKIVVALEGARPGLPSEVAAHLESTKKEVAAAKGAVGFIGIDAEPATNARGIERVGRPQVGWVAGDRATRRAAIAADVALSASWEERLFSGARQPLEAIREQAQRGPVAGFPLPGRVAIHSESAWESLSSPQVVARLAGADPKLADEHVVVMGHLDHHGVKSDAAPGEDAIYNGALDNAAGVAAVIEAAREFVESPNKPRRSVLFVATTAEEHGLLGAEYLAAFPPIPAERIVAVVNLDMPLLLYDFTDVVDFGAGHSTLDPLVREAGKSMGIALAPDPMPEQSLFVRSDHYMFVRRGVPAVFLMTGQANGGKAAWDKYLASTYHRPNDDLSQPIDWRAGARFAQLNYRIARAIADAPQRPLWYSGDYFGTALAPGAPKAARQP